MPRAKSSRPRPPRYILEPGALIYESVRQALGIRTVSAEARDTYRVILGFAWVNKYQFTPPITRRQIADERSIADEGTITRHINELVQAGYLAIQPGDGSANTYIPHITYQTDTTTATAHSPAVFPADPQHDTAHSTTQPTAHSGTQPPTEPHAHAPGVSVEPHAPAPGVPINSSSSVLTLNQDLNSQQLLLNILLDLGVFPDSARDMLAGAPYADILAWLHSLVEDDGVRNIASVLVANVLRDRRPPPCGPDPGSRWERDRIQREIEWGLRQPPQVAPQPVPPSLEEVLGPAVPIMSADMQQASQIWQRALGELQLQLTTATYDTWLRRTCLMSASDGVYVIGVHNGYAKDWLENRLYSMIKRTLTGILDWPVEVRFVVLNEVQHESVTVNS